MSTTIHLPDGSKVRLASQRRYVVIRLYTDRWVPVYRTDLFDRARTRWFQHRTDCLVIDQAERTVVWPTHSPTTNTH